MIPLNIVISVKLPSSHSLFYSLCEFNELCLGQNVSPGPQCNAIRFILNDWNILLVSHFPLLFQTFILSQSYQGECDSADDAHRICSECCVLRLLENQQPCSRAPTHTVIKGAILSSPLSFFPSLANITLHQGSLSPFWPEVFLQ